MFLIYNVCKCGFIEAAEVSQFSTSFAPRMYMRRVAALPFDSMLKRLN